MTADKQSVKLLYYLTTWMTKNPARDTFLRHTSTARVTWTCPWTQALTSRIYLRNSKYHKVRRLAIEPLRWSEGVHLAFSSVPSGFLLEWLGPWQSRLREAESNLRCAIRCKNVDMRAWYSIYRSSQITSRKTDWALSLYPVNWLFEEVPTRNMVRISLSVKLITVALIMTLHWWACNSNVV